MARVKIQRKNVVGPNLHRIRTGAGLSQEELAARCQRLGWDIARDTITRIEGRKRLVTDYEILLLALALKVNPTVFFPYKIDPRQCVPPEDQRG
jgi:transcriptional regulator with XRE-family HTH domain